MTIRQKFADFVAYRRAMRELSSMDDRSLRDIGIQRADIRNVLRQPAT
jgi:uncharacterized protein YjiS (DUF1127 family)